MSDAERLIAEILDEANKLRRFRKIDFYQPYPKQREFHALGAAHRERGLIAANRVGKSECAAYETACHLTGLYPDWWEGKRFTRPIKCWAAGEDGELVRDVIQAKLCGTPGVVEDFGTGYIPKDLIVDTSLARGTTDLYDTIQVRHKAGGVSTLTFKTYGEGRKGFQAATLDWIWFDEEPPEDVHSEGLTRLATTQGHSIATFTPLKGRTAIVKRFKEETSPERASVQMGIYDAGHFTKEQADAQIAAYPAHERDARAYGTPQMGEGRIFETPEDELKVPAMEVPPHWAKIGGLDFGGQGARSHPFAYVLLAIDRDNDIIYLVHSIRQQGTTKLQHIPAIRDIASEVPVAWPHDGQEKRDGVTVAEQYRHPMPGMPGLNMLPTHSTWPKGSGASGFEKWPAVHELDDRCSNRPVPGVRHPGECAVV